MSYESEAAEGKDEETTPILSDSAVPQPHSMPHSTSRHDKDDYVIISSVDSVSC